MNNKVFQINKVYANDEIGKAYAAEEHAYFVVMDKTKHFIKLSVHGDYVKKVKIHFTADGCEYVIIDFMKLYATDLLNITPEKARTNLLDWRKTLKDD